MSDEILAERARLLARPRAATAAGRSTLAVFERAGVRYAIDPRFVYEVARAPRPTKLPRSERHWLGVTSLHGELLAVADLAVLLGDEGIRGGEASALLVVLGTHTRDLALEVDAVLEPVSADIPRDEPPDASSLIEGVTADGLRVVRGETLLADPRLIVNPTSQEA